MIGTHLISIPSWGTITLIEAIWLFSGLIALVFTIAHMRALVEDYLSSAKLGRPILAAVSWGYLRRELIRFAQGTCLTVIGVYAAWEPNPIPGPAKVSPVGLILTAVLFALGFLVTLQSYWDWNTRHEVQRLIIEGNGNGNGH